MVASFFWSLGIIGDSKDGYCLEQCTKIIELIGVYDDVYDVYGTLDELELFTDVVERFELVTFLCFYYICLVENR